MPKEIKYGHIRGPSVITDEWPIAASITFSNRGGKFVKLTSNRLDIAGSGDTAILGWLLIGTGTSTTVVSSSTAGQTKGEVNISHLSIYRIPADADPANTRGEMCDLIVTSNVQYADVGESNEDILRIIAADEADDTVDVHLWTPNVTAPAVA